GRGGAPTTANGCSGSSGSPRGRWWSRGGTTSSPWKRPMLTINVVTLFPEVVQAALAVSIPGRAAERGLARDRVVQLRDYTHDRHHTVDDSPHGGGARTVLKREPSFEAVEDLRSGAPIVESAASDSHYDGLLSPPSYTRPPSYRGMDVPAVLLSGDHEKIAAWRAAQAERLTRERRPDLWARYQDRG